MQCNKCGGDMWDNRYNKRNPKAPDYKCKQCNHAIWENSNSRGQGANYQAPPPKRDTQQAITIGQSWNLAVASLSEQMKDGFPLNEIEERAKQFYKRIMAWQQPKPAAPQAPPVPEVTMDTPTAPMGYAGDPGPQQPPMPHSPEDDLPF